MNDRSDMTASPLGAWSLAQTLQGQGASTQINALILVPGGWSGETSDAEPGKVLFAPCWPTGVLDFKCRGFVAQPPAAPQACGFVVSPWFWLAQRAKMSPKRVSKTMAPRGLGSPFSGVPLMGQGASTHWSQGSPGSTH